MRSFLFLSVLALAACHKDGPAPADTDVVLSDTDVTPPADTDVAPPADTDVTPPADTDVTPPADTDVPPAL